MKTSLIMNITNPGSKDTTSRIKDATDKQTSANEYDYVDFTVMTTTQKFRDPKLKGVSNCVNFMFCVTVEKFS